CAIHEVAFPELGKGISRLRAAGPNALLAHRILDEGAVARAPAAIGAPRVHGVHRALAAIDQKRSQGHATSELKLMAHGNTSLAKTLPRPDGCNRASVVINHF